jgi:predicted PurR-regulated permease PerM
MSRERSAYSFDGDLMRIAVVAVVVGVVVGLALHVSGVGGAVLWGVLAGALSTVLVGPLSARRPARSNSSG